MTKMFPTGLDAFLPPKQILTDALFGYMGPFKTNDFCEFFRAWSGSTDSFLNNPTDWSYQLQNLSLTSGSRGYKECPNVVM